MPLEHYEVRFKNRDGKMIARQIEDSYGGYSLDLAMGNERFYSFDDIPNFYEIAPYLREFSILSPISGNIDLSIFKEIHKLTFCSSRCEIEGLGELKNLEYLNLSYTRFKKIKGLDQLKDLRRLNLKNANLDTIPVLGDLKKLERLDLSHNQISKIEGLDGLKNLINLDLSHNKISKIKGLDALRKIYEINLSNNQISKIQGLSKLRNLYQLSLSFNPIAKIENLNGVNKPLKLTFKPIAKIENLNGLNSLRIISLSDTNINSIAGIESVSDLYSLNIANTNVSSLEPLKKFKKIHSIRAKNCPIRSLHGISKNPDRIREFLVNHETLRELIRSPENLSELIINPENLCPTGAQLYKTAISTHSSIRNFDIHDLPALLDFYHRSATDLAVQYVQSNSEFESKPLPLTAHEVERLIHEATQKERTILENAVDTEILSQDDHILSQITARLSVDISGSPDLKILL